MRKSSFRFLSLIVVFAIILTTIMIPLAGIVSAAADVIDEIVVQEKIDEAVNGIVGFGNHTTDDEILTAITTALGTEYEVTKYTDFQKEAAVHGARVQIGTEEYFTRTAAGKISGRVLVKTSIDQYLFSFQREIAPVVDNETYVYAETDVVPNSNYSITNDVTFNNKKFTMITDVNVDGYKVMVIDGDVIGAQAIAPTGFHTTANVTTGSSKLTGVEVAIVKNIALTQYAFAEAPDLEVVILDTNVTNAGANKTGSENQNKDNFRTTPKLKYASFCEGIKYIGLRDFYQASQLKAFYVPDSVTAVGYWAFCQSGIEAVRLPEKVANANWFDDSAGAATGAFNACQNLLSVKLPEGLSNIAGDNFQDCKKLETVIFNSDLAGISSNAFKTCNSLEFVEIPQSVSSLHNNAFTSAAGLKYIVIPSTSIASFGTSLAAGVKIATWQGTALYNHIMRSARNRYVNIAALYSIIPNATVNATAETFKNTATITVTPNAGYKLPKLGIIFSYKTTGGVLCSPEPVVNEARTEFTFTFDKPIVSDIAINLNQNYTREDMLAIQRSVQAVIDEALENGTINANTTQTEILNLVNDEIYDVRVSSLFIEEMDKVTPVNSAEIYLDGNLLEKTEARDGHIVGAIGIKAGKETCVVTFSKELKAETVKYEYTSADVANGKLVIVDNGTEIGDTYKDDGFVEAVIVKNNITAIADGAFSGCSNLKVAVIGANVATLGKDMFKDATALTNVELSDTITTISANAFSGALSLNALIMPSKLAKFDNDGQFVNSGVEDVILPKTIDKNTVKDAVFNPDTRIYYEGAAEKQNFVEALAAMHEVFENYSEDLNTEKKLLAKLKSVITNSEYKVDIESFKLRVNRVITTTTLSKTVEGTQYSHFITIDKTFTDAELQEIIDYAQVELDAFKANNDTTAEDVMNAVKAAIDEDSYTYEWIQIFDKTRSIDGAKVLLEGKKVGETPTVDGRITGVIGITKDGKTATVPVDLIIKAKVETYSYKKSDKAPDSCFTINSSGKLEKYDPGSKVYPLVIVPEGVKNVDNRTGFGSACTAETVILPNTVGDIGWNTFYNNSNTEVVVLSDNVTKLLGYNFLNAQSIKYIKLSNNMRTIGPRVFTECPKLKCIKLPDALAYIDHATLGSNGLKEITIPENVELIYYNAFRGKDSLDGSDSKYAFVGLEKITVLSKNVRYLDTYMLRSDPTKSSAKEEPNALADPVDAAQFPARWHSGRNIIIASYKGSTTDVLVKKNIASETGTKYTSVYLEQSYLDAINAAEEVMNNIPSDTETSDYLKQFVEKVITNEDVTVTVTDFAYNGVKVSGTVEISTVVDGVKYSSVISGSKKLKISGYNSMLAAIKKVFATYKFTDDTTAADVEAAVLKAIDSGSAKISWSVPYFTRESVGGAYIKAPGIYREIKGVDGHVAGYLHVEYRGKKADIKLDRMIPCNMETLKYSSVSKDEDFVITNRSIYGYNGTAEVVVFPENVDSMQPAVFQDKTGFKAVIVNENMKKFGYFGFRRATDLEAIYIPEACADLAQSGTPSKHDKEMGGVFDGCSSLKYVRMSRYTTIIPYFSFVRCSSLKEFYIHEGIEKICQRSFWQSCGPLDTKTIVLPSSLTLFHTWAFAGISGTDGNVNFSEIHVLSDNLKYENSDPVNYPTARPIANFLNHPVTIYHPEGLDVEWAKNITSMTIYTASPEQTAAQAAVDLQRLFDDFAVTEETTVKDLNKKIDKLITNDNLRYKWTTPFRMKDVEQKEEGKITGAIKVYDKNKPALSFTVQLDTTIPLFQWIDDRVITILDSDMVGGNDVSVIEKNDDNNKEADVTETDSGIFNYVLYAGIAVLACAIITIVLVIIIKKKKAKKAE